jgi:hypothetical protein
LPRRAASNASANMPNAPPARLSDRWNRGVHPTGVM